MTPHEIKIIEHISLDGVIQVSGEDGDFPYDGWTAQYRTPAGRDAIIAADGESSTLTSTLLEHRLSDEVLLIVYPVPVGHREALLWGGNPAPLIRTR